MPCPRILLFAHNALPENAGSAALLRRVIESSAPELVWAKSWSAQHSQPPKRADAVELQQYFANDLPNIQGARTRWWISFVARDDVAWSLNSYPRPVPGVDGDCLLEAFWCKGGWDYACDADDMRNCQALLDILRRNGVRFLLLGNPQTLQQNLSVLDFESRHGWPFDLYLYRKLFCGHRPRDFSIAGSFGALQALIEDTFGHQEIACTETSASALVAACDSLVLDTWGKAGLQAWLGLSGRHRLMRCLQALKCG